MTARRPLTPLQTMVWASWLNGQMHDWPDARMARCTNGQVATCRVPLAMKSFRFIAAAVLATSLVALAGCSSEQASVEDPAPEWLFTIQATGTTAYDSDTRQLTMPVESVLAFTDRPERLSQTGDPQQFADLWNDTIDDSFTADPPNIVFTWWPTDAGSSGSTQVASIAGDVQFDSATSLLSMTLNDDGDVPLNLPAAMTQASMFVDTASVAECAKAVWPFC